MTSPDLPLSAVGALTRRGDRDRFEAALFAPDATRERLFALYAFNLEAASAPWKVSEPQIGAMRLRFLLDVVKGVYEGASPLAHEVAEPFHAALKAGPLPERALLEGLVEARLRDLDPAPMEDRSAFDAHVAATSGALMRVAAHMAAGGETAAQAEMAADLGYAQGVAALLEATPRLASLGRLMVPPAPEGPDIDVQAVFRGETPDGLRVALAAIGGAGLQALQRARARRRAAPAEAAPAFLAAWRAERLLRAAQQPTVDMVRDLGPESPFRRRWSLLWRGISGRW